MKCNELVQERDTTNDLMMQLEYSKGGLLNEMERLRLYIEQLKEQLGDQELLKSKCNNLIQERDQFNNEINGLSANKINLLSEMDKLQI